MRLDQRLVVLQSWWVASELARRHPSLGIIETHPGGGTYDCLSIMHWQSLPSSLVDLNREGSLHVHPDHIGALSWEEELQAEDRRSTVRHLEELAGLNPPSRTPSTTPRSLTFRVAYQLLLLGLNDRNAWDVRNARIDTSGYSDSRGDVDGFPTAQRAARDQRADDPYGDPLYRFWKVSHDGRTVMVLDIDGSAHFRSGHPADLQDHFCKANRSVEAVATWLRAQISHS